MNTDQIKRRGRPRIGAQIGVKLPAETLARLDRFAAARWPMTRSEAARTLLESALSGPLVRPSDRRV
jgi:hypothetical protein